MNAALQLGLQLMQQGQSEQARDALHRAVEIEPANPLGHHLLGLALFQAHDIEAALSSLRHAAALAPGDPVVHGNLGAALLHLGRFEEAADSVEHALQAGPDDVDALLANGDALVKAGRPESALKAFDRAIALAPETAAAWTNRGAALIRMNRFAEALDAFTQATTLDPRDGRFRFNRASALIDLGQHAEALEELGAAMALDPSLPNARLSAAFAHLALGSFERGWDLYEARWAVSHGQSPVAEDQRLWSGPASLRGSTVLLRAEQGLGDTLQFCRYAERVKARGARVILQVQPDLVRLMRSMQSVDVVAAQGDPEPEAAHQAFLMSLPLALSEPKPFVADAPYLSAEPDKVAWWRARLGAPERPRVGLIWASGIRGDPRHDWIGKRRNVPLDQLEALKGAPVDFISLQKGEPAESEFRCALAAGWEGPPILDVSEHLRDFSDTAALMETLDLVISVDTAAAHLAGALGKPLWVMNRFDSCWRWMCGRNDSPWYPTARLFRQYAPGDWSAVMAQVAEALAAFADSCEHAQPGST